ncbi:hypothetical protein [Streptomyces ardesiacus]|uniref:hypothetical protein n=1 Tax=Streptomyces ardesiacus TaxID=285564 RepID=UPI00381E4B47
MRIRRALGAAALAALVTITGIVMASDTTLAPESSPQPSPTVDHVAVFNDGFTESKQDDCDQGFQPACDWLSHNN